MVQFIRYFYIGMLAFLLTVSTLPMTKGQPPKSPLQHILFKDLAVSANLNAYIRETKAKAVAVSIQFDKTDNGYLFHLYEVSFYERIKTQPTPFWSQWNNGLVVVYASTDVFRRVCTLTDTLAAENLLAYANKLLPMESTPENSSKEKKGNIQYLKSNFREVLEWRFKLINGREVLFYTNEGIDSREVPDTLPPVKEHKYE